MKKLGVSLVAVLVGLPMVARADISAVTLMGNPAGTVSANRNVATTSYVQGAYNDLAGHINTNIQAINTLNGDASTSGSVAKAVADGVAGKQDQLVNDAGTPADVSNVVKTEVGAATGQNAASDTALVTEKAVRTAIDAVANNTLTNSSALNGANLTAGTVAKTALAQGVQDSLDAADSAVQSVTTGSTNGTISVDGAEVSVAGLGSAAYVNTNALAGTSGTFDDTNAQLGTTTIQGAIEAVAATATAATGTKGFNVYGNWATPDTATGHVNVTAESGLTANP